MCLETFVISVKEVIYSLARKTFTTTIEEDLQKAFKETCAEKGEKMNDVIEAFMQGYINGDFTLEKEVKYTLKKSK